MHFYSQFLGVRGFKFKFRSDGHIRPVVVVVVGDFQRTSSKQKMTTVKLSDK